MIVFEVIFILSNIKSFFNIFALFIPVFFYVENGTS